MSKYEIVIKGHIKAKRFETFNGLEKTYLVNGCTKLSGYVDQAALHSILHQIRNMGLTLVSVNIINT